MQRKKERTNAPRRTPQRAHRKRHTNRRLRQTPPIPHTHAHTRTHTHKGTATTPAIHYYPDTSVPAYKQPRTPTSSRPLCPLRRPPVHPLRPSCPRPHSPLPPQRLPAPHYYAPRPPSRPLHRRHRSPHVVRQPPAHRYSTRPITPTRAYPPHLCRRRLPMSSPPRRTPRKPHERLAPLSHLPLHYATNLRHRYGLTLRDTRRYGALCGRWTCVSVVFAVGADVRPPCGDCSIYLSIYLSIYPLSCVIRVYAIAVASRRYA